MFSTVYIHDRYMYIVAYPLLLSYLIYLTWDTCAVFTVEHSRKLLQYYILLQIMMTNLQAELKVECIFTRNFITFMFSREAI